MTGKILIGRITRGGRAAIVGLLVVAARSVAYSCGVRYDEESRKKEEQND